jgi:hypothetical protein
MTAMEIGSIGRLVCRPLLSGRNESRNRQYCLSRNLCLEIRREQMSAGEGTLSDATVGATVNADNPWPGLLAFSETDKDYFQGRQVETEELFRLALRERLTVLLGLSGLGKSSLLRAGLFPRLRNENLFPVYIRLDYSSALPDLVAQVCATIAKEASLHEIEAPLRRNDETLWEYFHREANSFWNVRNKLVVPFLVFDQFEEIFTLGHVDPDRSKATEAFLDQLADLSECRPSALLKKWIDDHPNEASAFDFGRHHYKFLLGIREDFLPDLEVLRARMPALALNRFRLRRMNGEAARLVVNQAQRLIDPVVGEEVVRFVSAAKNHLPLVDLEVEPALLSVVCRELNNRRLTLNEPKISAALLQGNQEEVLADFYERSTEDLTPEVRSFIEDHLITVNGFRDSVALENALSTPGVSRQVIETLVERRLLRPDDRGGTQRLELTHDLLAGVVRVSRDNRRVKEDAEKERSNLLRAQEEQKQALLKAAEDERRELELVQQRERSQRAKRDLRRLQLFFAIIAVALLIAVALGIYAFSTSRTAIKDKRLAEAAATDATNQKEIAIEAQKQAQSQIDKYRASLQLLSSVKGTAVQAAVDSQLSANLLPRVYVQIVDQGDRDYAEYVKNRLTTAGVLVLGIQYVPKAAATQSKTDVRYYRQADEAEAGKIVEALKAGGQGSAYAFIPKGQENNPNVRPNHFEVWLAKGSGGSTCQSGYVWREATPTDHVCVSPDVRAQTANDNALAASRRAENGPYGPDTCKEGFVWRDAVPGDHVCVSPTTRTQTSNDNAAAQSRILR